MNIKDLIIESDRLDKKASVEESSESNQPTDLNEVEKTASLLDKYASDDTIIDELAKLAVLKDFLKARSTDIEKVANINKEARLRDRLVLKLSKIFKMDPKRIENAQKMIDMGQERKVLKDAMRIADDEMELALLKRDVKGMLADAKAYSEGGMSLSGPMLLGGAAVGGAAAYGTKQYLDKKHDEEKAQLAEKMFYAGADAALKGGA
tara:strand:- start:502 stop:1122 length:621 start_codon:yes stop_codon:yes gene_type:complete